MHKLVRTVLHSELVRENADGCWNRLASSYLLHAWTNKLVSFSIVFEFWEDSVEVFLFLFLVLSTHPVFIICFLIFLFGKGILVIHCCEEPAFQCRRYPLQYSCLENPIGRGAWRATVRRVAKSRKLLKPLSMHTHMLGNKLPRNSVI